MRLFKEIFGRLWAVWAMLLFLGTMLVFLVPFFLFCYFLPDPLRTHRFVMLARVWMRTYLFLIGCPVRIVGKHHFRKNENYIVVCNHNSFMDVPLSTPLIPGGNKTIAKIEMAKIPVFGTLYRVGSVLVDRKSEASRKESYSRMKDVLKMGLHMCIYPEGTRNRSTEPIKNFHSGAFRLATDTGKAIIPAVIFHSKKVLPPGKFFYAFPHPLAIHFLSPEYPRPGETSEQLKLRVHALMTAYYLHNR